VKSTSTKLIYRVQGVGSSEHLCRDPVEWNAPTADIAHKPLRVGRGFG